MFIYQRVTYFYSYIFQLFAIQLYAELNHAQALER